MKGNLSAKEGSVPADGKSQSAIDRAISKIKNGSVKVASTPSEITK